ncbi:MAG: hypothetical protein JXQ71_10055 [Verrucomicrobia bacterium]|nr:hypothetical protein [Verrucomicrobiota bacterium]
MRRPPNRRFHCHASWDAKVAQGAGFRGKSSGVDQNAVTLGNTDSKIAGLTISDPPTQAELQALREKCEELADDVRALSTLVHALNAALSFAVATDPGTLYPRCDGADTPCQLKFSNFANWGGHRIPLRNLTLKAVEIKAGSGGKK